jgi:hypothetical protein
MHTNTQNTVRDDATAGGWEIYWDNEIQFRIVRGEMIVHVEWTRAGRIRWATLETRIAPRTSRVEQVAPPRNKLATVEAWLLGNTTQFI